MFQNTIVLLIILLQKTIYSMNLKQSLTKNKNVSKICLRKSSLNQFPPSLYIYLPSIVHLDLSHNRLINHDFDLICHNAPCLKKLIINNNIITIIPKSIQKAVNLQFLSMDWYFLLSECEIYRLTNKNNYESIDKIRRHFQYYAAYNEQSVQGITFKTFLSQICKIQVNPSIKKKIMQCLQKVEMHQQIKNDIRKIIEKNMKIQIQEILQNPQKNQFVSKLDCLTNLEKQQPKNNKKLRIFQEDSKCTSADRKISITPQKIKLSRSKSQKMLSIRSPRSKNNKIVIQNVKNIKNIDMGSPKSSATREISTLFDITHKNGIDFSKTTNQIIFNIFQHFDQSPLTSMTIIQRYIKQTLNFNIYDSFGLSPFHYLIIKQQFQGMVFALKTNEKYNYPIFNLTLPNKSEKRNLLHLAAFLKDKRMIIILLQHGYPINAHDYKGYRAIHLIDENPEILALYKKIIKKRKKHYMPDFIACKCAPVSRIQQQSQANGLNLLKMYQNAVNYTKK